MGAGLKVGVNQGLWYNSGTDAIPTWGEITIARNVKIGLSKNLAEIKARLSNWVQHLPAMKMAPLEFDMIKDTSVALYNTLRDAWINDTLVDLAVGDDVAITTSGSDYFRAHFYLKDFGQDQQLEEGETVSVQADLAYSTRVPAFVDVA